MESLEAEDRRTGVRKKLQNLSTEINDKYDDIIQRIDRQQPQRRDMALQIIKWVANAGRALKLEELQHALAVSPGDPKFDDGMAPLKEDVTGFCCGLVLADPRSGIVRLVHYTAKHYLDKLCGTDERFKGFEPTMALVCATYLCISELEQPDDLENGSLVSDLYDDQSSSEDQNIRYSYLRTPKSAVESSEFPASPVGIRREVKRVTWGTDYKPPSFWSKLSIYPFAEYAGAYLGHHMQSIVGLEDPLATKTLSMAYRIFAERPKMLFYCRILKESHMYPPIIYHNRTEGWMENDLAIDSGRPDVYVNCDDWSESEDSRNVNENNKDVAAGLGDEYNTQEADVDTLGSQGDIDDDEDQIDDEPSDSSDEDVDNVVKSCNEPKGDLMTEKEEVQFNLKIDYAGDRIEEVYHSDKDPGAPSYQQDVVLEPLQTKIVSREITPLHLSAYIGSVYLTDKLLNEDLDASVQDPHRHTPLTIALQLGHADVVIALLEAGTPVDITSEIGRRVLLFAAESGHTKIVQGILRRAGAVEIGPATANNQTWVHIRLYSWVRLVIMTYVLGFFQALLVSRKREKLNSLTSDSAQSADTILQARRRNSSRASILPLELLPYVELISAAFRGDCGFIERQIEDEEISLKAGATRSDAYELAKVALFLAVETQSVSVVRLLIEKGLDVNKSRDYKMRTPLHRAAARQNPTIIKMLLDHGAKVDARDKWMETPWTANVPHTQEGKLSLNMFSYIVHITKFPS
jgi:hypothetical protein